jgi:hypothetical protein
MASKTARRRSAGWAASCERLPKGSTTTFKPRQERCFLIWITAPALAQAARTQSVRRHAFMSVLPCPNE